MSQHVHYKHPETEADKWNSAVITALVLQFGMVPQMVHTLLVFFNRMRSHWSMMLIHLASLCLTSSGGGPTLLTQNSTSNTGLSISAFQCVSFITCTVLNSHLTGDSSCAEFLHAPFFFFFCVVIIERPRSENQDRKQENHTVAV